MDSMNYFQGRLRMERRLWNESHTREPQMVDEILRPWVRQRISEGVAAGEMLGHESAAALLDEYAAETDPSRSRAGFSFLSFPLALPPTAAESDDMESWQTDIL